MGKGWLGSAGRNGQAAEKLASGRCSMRWRGQGHAARERCMLLLALEPRSACIDIRVSSICEHGRKRSSCKSCGGASICEHGHHRTGCKSCGGGSICKHGCYRTRCKSCGGGRRRLHAVCPMVRMVPCHDGKTATDQEPRKATR
jgi:hypothetical protein